MKEFLVKIFFDTVAIVAGTIGTVFVLGGIGITFELFPDKVIEITPFFGPCFVYVGMRIVYQSFAYSFVKGKL